MVWIALIAMMCLTLAQHLGLTQAIAEVASKIAECPKCCSWWGTLLVLILLECDIFIAIGLSLLMAYLSHWFGFVLLMLNNIYDRVWEKLQRKKKK